MSVLPGHLYLPLLYQHSVGKSKKKKKKSKKERVKKKKQKNTTHYYQKGRFKRRVKLNVGISNGLSYPKMFQSATLLGHWQLCFHKLFLQREAQAEWISYAPPSMRASTDRTGSAQGHLASLGKTRTKTSRTVSGRHHHSAFIRLHQLCAGRGTLAGKG